MKKTGYFIFHSNLAFSAIPQAKREEVLTNAYYPLCEIVESLKVPIGWEFPGKTLEEIEELDPFLLGWIKKLAKKNLVEPICSGYIQSIFPLWPHELNEENLKEGIAVTRRIFKDHPSIAYCNELVFSRGIIDIYLKCNIKAIVVEFTNARKATGFEKIKSLRPAQTCGLNGKAIKVIWAHSPLAQKFQRAAQEEQIAEFLSTAENMATLGPLPLYSSDLEVIGYRPWQEKPCPQDWKRVQKTLKELINLGFEIVTPSHVLALGTNHKNLDLTSCDEPCITKKQDKYNITRWAVAGRDDVRINAQTLRIWSLYKTATNLNSSSVKLDRFRKDLLVLTGSDFRTHTSDDRHTEFRNTAGFAEISLKKLVENPPFELPTSPLALTIFNPHELRWDGVLSAKLFFKPKLITKFIEAHCDGKPLQLHLSEIGRYPDSSIKSAVISLRTRLAPKKQLQIKLSDVAAQANATSPETTVKTSSVSMELLPNKGYTIKSLEFKNFGKLIGHIPHGYYEHPSFAYDYFCGHVVIWDRDGKQLTDLDSSELLKTPENSGGLFEEVWAKSEIKEGEILKIYRVYKSEPLFEIEYRFTFSRLKPRAFRIGILNLLPEMFDESALECASVLGGKSPELFRLDKYFDQAQPVNPIVTAGSGYTASEGWLGISDSKKAISAIAQRNELFGIFLVRHLKPQPDRPPVVRAYYTIGENDETNEVFWRGHSRLKFFITAHKPNEWDKTRSLAKSLIYPIMAWQGREKLCP